MAGYRMSFTGQEINNKLKMIDEGGIGYTEQYFVYGCDLTEKDSNGYTSIVINPAPIELSVNRRYTITTDSGEFSVVCKVYENTGAKYLGNADIFGLENTGEPFIITDTYDNEKMVNELKIIDFDGGSSCTIAEPTIHRINIKYLPDTVASTAYVEEKVATIPAPDVSGEIEAHNTSTDSHNDIRLSIQDLTIQTQALTTDVENLTTKHEKDIEEISNKIVGVESVIYNTISNEEIDAMFTSI